MAIIPQLDRLKAQLLTSGLSQRNNALFQVINQLIDALRQGINELEGQITIINTPSPGSGGGTIVTSAAPLGDINSSDESNDDWNWGPQGKQGIQGNIGLQGPPGMDGEDCECESMPFVGTSLYP
jgi:hypothetical protein